MSDVLTPEQQAQLNAFYEQLRAQNQPAKVLSPEEQAKAALAALDELADGIEGGTVPFDAHAVSVLRDALKAVDNAYGSGRSASAG